MSDADRKADIERAVVGMLKASDGPVWRAVLLRELSVTGKDLLDLECQGIILGELLSEGGLSFRAYRLPFKRLDPDKVRAHTVSMGLCEKGSPIPVSPPEFRAYESYLQNKRRHARTRKARQERDAAATRRRRRADLIAGWPVSRMPRIRAWAQEQGLDVGARGRLPSWVVDKYHQEVDDEARLQALLRQLGLSDETGKGAGTRD
ncbi:histone-like nucleoid-structuring protein Lsr2 [Streptomyces sp. NPDC007172]|uniref:Lsr2 family DNA-binding protein n=1 Tax=Streptomyces sp. NPDC007172 TaxID=3364776 RepID=UPI0036AC244E